MRREGAGGAGVAASAGSAGVAGGASAGVGGTSGGAGASGAAGVPTKDGVPIGDCSEPTAAEQATRGCPVQAPTAESSCAAPDGLVCRYAIETSDGVAWQTMFTCQYQSWGPGVRVTCGTACGAPLAQASELSGACSALAITSCAAASMSTYAYPTDDQLLNEMFVQQIVACGAPTTGVRYQLEVSDGCPTRVSTDLPLDPMVLDCLKGRLANVRWDCAQRLTCSTFAQYLL